MRLFRSLVKRLRRNNPVTDDERLILSRCLRSGDTVFDIGANEGKWSQTVLKKFDVHIHAFEAADEAFKIAKEALPDHVTLNKNAVSDTNDDLSFFVYRDDARLSSLHRRHSVEDTLLSGGFEKLTVPGITLDNYWGGRSEQIRFVKVDVEGAEYSVLRGANELLRRGRIDFLQFEYGGTFEDAGTTLRSVWALLKRFGYSVFRVENGKFIELKSFKDRDEDYKYSNFLAVNDRIRSSFLGEGEEISLRFDRMEAFGIKPAGVLHVGAHKGDEITTYRKHGVTPIVFVEANPTLADGLRNRFQSEPDVFVIEAAASDTEGRANFNVTNMDQSSSLLPLKDHSNLYPRIKVAEQINVRTARIDDLLKEIGLDTREIGLTVMDIQGAELMALKGAPLLLKEIQALQLEVNYAELYAGCAEIGELDTFLEGAGFLRCATMSPYSDRWGDALYVRRPSVTCSAIGNRGRFANALFQYIFLRSYGLEFDYKTRSPVWDGDRLFEVQSGDPEFVPCASPVEEDGLTFEDANIVNEPEGRPNTDFSGFFQYHTRYYRPHRDRIRKELRFKGKFKERAEEIFELFQCQPGPVAALHLRRGDFGTGVFFIAPNEWYLDWLTRIREEHPTLSVYIASDDLDAVLPDYADLNPITARDLSNPPLEPGFFDDFAALRAAQMVAISNSSFSFAAAMLNERASNFVRPCLTAQSLIPFKPWDAPVLLREKTAEEAGEQFMSEAAKNRSKYKIRKALRGNR